MKMKFLPNLIAAVLFFHDTGASSADTVNIAVSVMEGGSVTLHTGVNTNSTNIKWYWNGTLIAQVDNTGNKSSFCTDVQCTESAERFRDRLKLDLQTGSLTIMNIRITDSGNCQMKILNGIESRKLLNIFVHDDSAAKQDEVKSAYFNYTLMAEISGHQFEDRIQDRLKLTIMNTTSTDSGDYQLKISFGNKHFNITSVKRVPVTCVPCSCWTKGVCIGVGCVLLLLGVVAGAGICHCYHSRRQATQNGRNANVQIDLEVL